MKHFEIPETEGLYWYYASGQDAEPVQISAKRNARYQRKGFAGFDGRFQSWLKEGEYLVGPQAPMAE